MGNPPAPNGSGARSFPSRISGRASRDTKLTTIVEVIEATGLPPRQAAMSVGISSSAWYRMAEDPAVVEAVENATAVHARRMAGIVARAASKLSWKAAAFWLERRLADVYGPRAFLKVEEDVPEAVKLARDPNVSVEELDARLTALVGELQRRQKERAAG